MACELITNEDKFRDWYSEWRKAGMPGQVQRSKRRPGLVYWSYQQHEGPGPYPVIYFPAEFWGYSHGQG